MYYMVKSKTENKPRLVDVHPAAVPFMRLERKRPRTGGWLDSGVPVFMTADLGQLFQSAAAPENRKDSAAGLDWEWRVCHWVNGEWRVSLGRAPLAVC